MRGRHGPNNPPPPHRDAPANYEEICAEIKEAAHGPLINILDYTDDKIILTNSYDNTYSSIFDGKAGISFNNNFVNLVSWYAFI